MASKQTLNDQTNAIGTPREFFLLKHLDFENKQIIYREFFSLNTHKFVLAGDVVGDFDAMEARSFAHPVLAGVRRFGMDVNGFRHLGIRFPRQTPF